MISTKSPLTVADEFLSTLPPLKGKTVAVALSGGADSVCLLSVMQSLQPKYGYTLCALHLNHGIRGNEAQRDSDFCQDLCKKLDIPLSVKNTDVPALKNQGESLETAARRLRYEFFDNFECDYVAVAHNKNDSAETALFNLLRGSGTRGAKGISKIRGKYIRPILLSKKSEIIDYCKISGLDFVTDSTNLVNDCTRNLIRNEIFPLFEKINSGFVDNISSFSEIAEGDNAFLCQMAHRELQAAQTKKGVDLGKIENMAYPIISRVILEYLNTLGQNADRKTVIGLYNAFCAGQDIKINTSKNTYVQIKNGILSLSLPQKNKDFSVMTQNVDNFALKNTFDRDKVIGNYQISVRRAGDTVKLKGRPTKELRKIFNELKIPANQRSRWPIIRDDKGVIWAYKIGTAERALPDKNSKDIIKVDVREQDVNS